MKTIAAPMTIGAAARQAGVGVETIRFYERRGLVRQPLKPAGSGVRHYSPETVAQIRFIREAQQIGFSLREIEELLALEATPDADCSNVRAQAEAKLNEVERKVAQLQQVKAALKTLLATCPGHGGLEACSIMDVLALHSERNMAERAGVAPARHHHTGGTGEDHDVPDRRHALRRVR